MIPHGFALFAFIVLADALVTALALMFLAGARTRHGPRFGSPPSRVRVVRRAFDWDREDAA